MSSRCASICRASHLPRPPPPAPDARTVVTVRDVVSRLAQIPSVEGVAIATDVPLAGSNAMFFTAEGQPPVTAQNVPRAYAHRVSPEFFRTMRIPCSPAAPSTRAKCKARRMS